MSYQKMTAFDLDEEYQRQTGRMFKDIIAEMQQLALEGKVIVARNLEDGTLHLFLPEKWESLPPDEKVAETGRKRP